MWLRNVYLRTLRGYRVGILGWGIGMGLVVVSPMASVAELVSSPQARAQLAQLARSFAWNADPVGVDTIGGYATFKIGVFVFLVLVWPILAASRTLRGEEERGSLDVLLAQPQPRLGVGLQKVAALWTAQLAAGLLVGAIAYLGGTRFGAEFSLGHGLLFGLDLALVAIAFGSIALLVSQFTDDARTAAGWTGGIAVVAVALDMVHRVFPNTDWISGLSPIYYYNLSKPLVPGHGASAGGMLVLLALSALLTAGALWLFTRRDVGGTVRVPLLARLDRRPSAPRHALPAGDWSLRSVYLRALGDMAWPTFWWTLGIAGFASWMVVVVEQMESQLSAIFAGSPTMQQLVRTLAGGDAGVNAGFLSAMFVLLPLALMANAVTQVNTWSGDEQDGRLELVLAAPQRREAVVLGRFVALATGTAVIGVVTLLAVGAAADLAGIRLDGGHLAAATLGMIPLALLVAALGYLGAGWLRTAADTGLLSFLLVAWFFVSFIGPELKWPEATLRLSAFYYYGTPLLHGLDVASVIEVVAVTAVALGLGVARFARKDIAS